MVTYTKANGKMTKLMEKEFTIIMTVPATQDNGVKIFSKATEYKNGSMDPHTKGKVTN
jgi:hypothetical protein